LLVTVADADMTLKQAETAAHMYLSCQTYAGKRNLAVVGIIVAWVITVPTS
jgi:hypothetical protein